jgi:hypothetical protein
VCLVARPVSAVLVIVLVYVPKAMLAGARAAVPADGDHGGGR